ncbi:hypothetical protein EVJ58_g8980 [Rhodofomes roseus]|uniref:F-box domain-containing protein n=1 Tax=Rhodofomes roseus TaxID=34475 RepID=A0A4Y9XYK4_9APHY|nr:hypothetical protein EVJ58_g8980 [Rhodofomes roseus]
MSDHPLATPLDLATSTPTEFTIDADDQNDLVFHVPKARKNIPRFPQELVDAIIDCLQDDRESLLACALTSQSWRPRSQTHIHRALKVTSKWHCSKAEMNYGDPFLASCIRELHIQDLSLKQPGDRAYWVDHCVPAMLSKLNRFHSLAIDSVIIQNGHDIQWGSYPDPLFPNVTKLTIRRLCFHVGAEFALFMRHFPRLTSLTLKDFTITYRISDAAAPGPRPPLRNLEIYSSSGQEFFLNWFLHQPSEAILLEMFVYSIERWQVRAPKPSLMALGASVKDLTIVFAFSSPHYLLTGDPLLPHLSSLRNLTFDHTTLFGTLYGPPSVPVLLKEISATQISTVRFRFVLDNQYAPLEQSVEKLERIKLGHTDGLLRDSQPFQSLQGVLVQIRSRDWARLRRLPSADQWIAADIEQRRVFSDTLSDLPQGIIEDSPPSARDAEREEDKDVEREIREHGSNLEWNNLKRARADYENTRETWHKAMSVVEKALPTMAASRILRIEPLEDALPERTSSSWSRHHHPHLYEHSHYTLYQ